MRALALAAAGAALLAGCAPGGPSARGNRLDLGGPRERDFVTANPSAVIAAELEFARAAREDGTWTAFREYSTADALWPGPALENVRQALAGAADPAAAIYRAVNSLLEPILRPIRRIMPDTGAIDFSPLVLIVLLNIVNIVLGNLALASAT